MGGPQVIAQGCEWEGGGESGELSTFDAQAFVLDTHLISSVHFFSSLTCIINHTSQRRPLLLQHLQHLQHCISMRLIHFTLLMLLLLAAPTFAIEATFTPNPADEKSGAGPLPQSLEQRKQLLELSVAIAQTPDPSSTLAHVAQQNGISAEELGNMLDRNTRDLQESGQLEEMLQGVQANLAAQGAGRGASGTLPRRIISLLTSLIVGTGRATAGQVVRHSKHSFALAMIMLLTLLAMHNIPKNGLVISTGASPFSRGHTTLFNPPVDYMQQHYMNLAGAWESSLPEPKEKKSKARKQAGGVGMTRFLGLDFSEAQAEKVTIETELDRKGFSLITTASQLILLEDVFDIKQNDDEEENDMEEAMEVMIESISALFEDRKFSEYPAEKMPLKWRSFVAASEDHDASEGAVMSMSLLGDFGRYGIQPFCFSYELDDESADDSAIIRCVAYHTLKGGHFDGELRFVIGMNESRTGAVISVSLAIPEGGRVISKRLAESIVESLTTSTIRSSQLRIKQSASRRKQSKHYRARSTARAKEKRHLRYEQEKLQEEMAAERKRKWKRNNPDAGHYRPSGHRLRTPGGSPNF